MTSGRFGAFAGATVVLPFGASKREAALARLQLGPAFAYADARTGSVVRRLGPGLDLGLTHSGKPDLRFAGRSPAQVEQRLGLKGSTGYIVAGGILVGVLLLAAIASASPKPGPRPGDFPS